MYNSDGNSHKNQVEMVVPSNKCFVDDNTKCY
jgi:hypothetical protein